MELETKEDNFFDDKNEIWGSSKIWPKVIFEESIIPKENVPKYCENEVIDFQFLMEINQENLTNDLGVIKFLVKEGIENKFPTEKSTCKVIYESRLRNGELIDKFRNTSESRKIKLKESDILKGFHSKLVIIIKLKNDYFIQILIFFMDKKF